MYHLNHDSRFHAKLFLHLLDLVLVKLSPTVLILIIDPNCPENARSVIIIIDHGQSTHGQFPISNLLVFLCFEILLLFEIPIIVLRSQ